MCMRLYVRTCCVCICTHTVRVYACVYLCGRGRGCAPSPAPLAADKEGSGRPEAPAERRGEPGPGEFVPGAEHGGAGRFHGRVRPGRGTLR